MKKPILPKSPQAASKWLYALADQLSKRAEIFGESDSGEWPSRIKGDIKSAAWAVGGAAVSLEWYARGLRGQKYFRAYKEGEIVRQQDGTKLVCVGDGKLKRFLNSKKGTKIVMDAVKKQSA